MAAIIPSEQIPLNDYPKDVVLALENNSLAYPYVYDGYEVKRSMVYLKLLSTLGTMKIYHWLPEGRYISNKKFFYIHPYKIITKNHLVGFADFNKEIRQYNNQLKSHLENMRYAANILNEQYDKNTINNLLLNISNALINHAGTLKEIQIGLTKPLKNMVGIVEEEGIDSQPNLLNVYMMNENISEVDAVERLAREFNIDYNNFTESKLEANWKQNKSVRLNLSVLPFARIKLPEKVIIVNSANGACLGGVELYNGELITKTYWRKMPDGVDFYLQIPFSKSYPVYGMDLIANNPLKPVYLTENIIIAHENNEQFLKPNPFSGAIWASWWGGADAVFDVDWKCLQGRDVHYVMSSIETDVKVFAMLKQAKVRSILCLKLNKRDREMVKCIKEPNFHFFARNENCSIPEVLSIGCKNNNGSGSKRQSKFEIIEKFDNIAKTEFLLEPVISEGSITMLYSDTGVGKTWLALSLGYSISRGKNMCKRWKNNNNPCSVLYIDSEMGEKTINYRQKIMESIYDDKKVDDKKTSEKKEGDKKLLIMSLSGKDVNLADVNDQDSIDKEIAKKNRILGEGNRIKLIILDNLSTLTEFNDSQKSWKEIFSWLQKYKEDGYSIIIVHHANKLGGQRGSSVKTATVDNVIHIKEVEYSGTARVMIEVTVEKGREIYGLAKEPFVMSMSPNSKNPYWEVCTKDMSLKKRDEIIKLRTKQKVPIEDIAIELGLAKITVQTRKKELSLTRPYTKKNNEKATKTNKKDKEQT